MSTRNNTELRELSKALTVKRRHDIRWVKREWEKLDECRRLFPVAEYERLRNQIRNKVQPVV